MAAMHKAHQVDGDVWHEMLQEMLSDQEQGDLIIFMTLCMLKLKRV